MRRALRQNWVPTTCGILVAAALLLSLVAYQPFSGENAVSGYGYGYDCVGGGGFGYGYNFSDVTCSTTTTAGGGGGGGGGTTTVPPPKTKRLAGDDRVETAIEVAQDSFPNGGAGAVVLARSDFYADALAGTPFAVAVNGPLLLTDRTTLDPRTIAEIQRVLPSGRTIYLLGGSAALNPAFDGQLTALGYVVVRVQGPNRYSTAVAVANRLGNPATVFEATGINFPDGLCGGAAAAKRSGAVLLTNGAAQAPETAAYLSANPPTEKYALGGPAATADPSAQAIVGADRYDTCAQVASQFFIQPTFAGVASGEKFPDALTGGAHIGKKGGPLLLTPLATLAPQTQSYLNANKATIISAYIYGGTVAVSNAVQSQIEAALT